MRLSGFHRQNDLLVVVHDNGVTVVGELLVELRVEGDVFAVRLLVGLIAFLYWVLLRYDVKVTG